MTEDQKELKRIKGYLTELIGSLETFLEGMDRVMVMPPTVERGRMIARYLNALEIAKDRAKYFGLKVPFKTKKGPGCEVGEGCEGEVHKVYGRDLYVCERHSRP
jgi:hypothetical protein